MIITIFHKITFFSIKVAVVKLQIVSQRIFNGYNNQSPQSMNTATFSTHDRTICSHSNFTRKYMTLAKLLNLHAYNPQQL